MKDEGINLSSLRESSSRESFEEIVESTPVVFFERMISINERSSEDSSFYEFNEEATFRWNIENVSSSGIFEVASSIQILEEEASSSRICEEATTSRIFKSRDGEETSSRGIFEEKTSKTSEESTSIKNLKYPSY